MIKEQVYIDTASTFGTSVGVAHIIGFKNKKEHIEEDGIESFKLIEDDLIINNIIVDAIDLGLYQTLQREIFHIKQKGSKRLKEITIYKRAWKEITNNENYITESGQIF
jgi:hypothetical protein